MTITALVTGANGFIGSTLVRALQKEGVQVRALTRQSSSLANLEGAEVERVIGSLEDLDSLERAVEGVDWVLHLAGVVRAKDKEGFFGPNAKGTENLVNAILKSNRSLKKLVYVSSIAAAGPAAQKQERVEDETPNPVSDYGRSKLEGEKAVIREKDSIPSVILRPPLVYGPRDRDIFLFVESVNRRFIPVIQASEGEKKFYSAIHSEDLCSAILKAARADIDQVPSGEVFYVCGDGIYSFDQIIDSISEHIGKKPLRFPVPPWVVKGAGQTLGWIGSLTGRAFPLNPDKVNEILPDYWIFSNQKAKRHLGFEPKYDLNRGMKESIRWYKEHHWI